ncbi:MFS transporter [Psychroflexus sp. MBR-150]|jgi:UMF1 family MFS transporter
MKSILSKGHPKLLHAWAFYDWANSVYSLVISSAIFPVYYGALTLTKNVKGEVINDRVEFFGFSFNNDALISYTTALAFLVVVIISPILSGIADNLGNKKRFMQFFCYLGGVSCIGLYFFELEYLGVGLLFYFLGLIGFWGSLVFYNSYLPDIAHKDQQDQVSAKGFSLGYIGSVILLLLCLGMILNYEMLGFESESLPTRLSFVLTGIWWIGFSQYSFYYLPQIKNENSKPLKQIILGGYKELRQVYRKIKLASKFKHFLTAFFMYSIAVQTIMLIATYFGVKEIQWPKGDATTGLITSILLIQFVAIAGAFFAARLTKHYANERVLIGINIIWVGVCIYAFFIKTPIQFYVAAFFVGLVMGAIQSLSRSTFSKYIPETETDTTSFFSFYDVTEKIGIVIGMSIYALVAQLTGNVRYAILVLLLCFVFGIYKLFQILKLSKR